MEGEGGKRKKIVEKGKNQVRFGVVEKTIDLCGVSSPREESLLFRQKEPKPFLPVRGPSEPAQKQALRDASASAPNQDGEGTRSAQTALAEKSIRDGGSAAPNALGKVKRLVIEGDRNIRLPEAHQF